MSPVDKLHAMRLFRRIVELKGFSAVAREQRLSNAAVTKHISALEQHLQTRLLHRTTRRVAPTAAGLGYYAQCVRILDDIEAAERSVSTAAVVPQGTLRVNVPMSFGLLHVAPVVPLFLARHRELRIELGFSDRFVDLVEEGLDVVVRVSDKLADSASLTAHKLADARHVICASPRYLREHGEPTSVADLAAHDCIDYSLAREPGEWAFETARGVQRVAVRGRLAVSNSLAIREALLAGVGIARVPSFYVEADLRAKRLRPLLTSCRLPPLVVYAVYLRSPHPSPKVRVFLEFLRERFASANWAT